MDWFRRLDLIVLALMLAYVVVVFVRVSYHCRAARRASEIDTDGRNLRKLAADLSIQVVNLKSIASSAPYFGLVGTCIGIVAGLRGVGFVAESGLAAVMLAGVVPAALITTVAGLLVAVPAAWSYNSLCTRIDLLECGISADISARRSRNSRFAQKFPLAARCSTIPFPVVAAPSLAILVGVVFMEYSSYKPPTGIGIELAPARCDLDSVDRLIVLRVTNGGEVFINLEQQEWSSLSERLSQIYSMRMYRTLYFLAEDGVPFQTVADAIDIAKNAQITGRSESLGITVRLITPAAARAPCLPPIATGPGQHASK